MKNILMTVATLLMLILIIVLMIRGASIGNFKILSIANIKTESQEIDKNIDSLNTKKNIDYKKCIDDLDKAIKALETSKTEYVNLAGNNLEDESGLIRRVPNYTMEFLWNKIGSYATKEGLSIKLEVNQTGVDNKNNLSFTLVGSYIGIINYVSNLENDSDLLFKIENFSIAPNTSVSELKATFKVLNIDIQPEATINSTSSITGSTTETTDIATGNITNNTAGTATNAKTNTTANNSTDAADAIDAALGQ